MTHPFDSSVQFLSGVGPRRAALLQKEVSISTVGDLLTHYPFRYVDRSRYWAIREAHPNLGFVQIRGRFTSMNQQGVGPKSRLVALFTDGADEIEVLFFQGIKWTQKLIKVGVEVILFGKVSLFNQTLQMVHPEIEVADINPLWGAATMQALYHSTEALKSNGFSQKVFARLIAEALEKVEGAIPETLPPEVIRRLKLIPKEIALKQIHFPQNSQMVEQARMRLKFEELFFIQLGLLKQKSLRLSTIQGRRLAKIGAHFYHAYQRLPFSLTQAQKRVLKEIRNDMGSGKQMNRLLQGDVGSGKTMVALFSALIALDNGYQACIMAPTELLAMQHFNTISKLLSGGPSTIGLLTGSTKRSERKVMAQKLSDASLHLLIGTHALIEGKVRFANLGFVVIDEQHRFGVEQRAQLWSKSEVPPHMLVMTATPIPRTLSMTLYGDLDLSVIDELPPGRIPVKSLHYTDAQRLHLFGFMKEQIKAGRQVYVVYPLIKESEKLDYKNLEDGYLSITRAFPAPEYTTSVVHGKQKNEDKAFDMKLFVEGKTHIMVATSVIEVGVDVPNATVMVIESAERFGLSQLHQLRGRVGRGAALSYCIFMTGHKLTKEARLRIELLCSTNNGFEVAEADLRQRGPGDVAGTLQSGLAFELKIANLSQDGQLLEMARNMAAQIIERDPILCLPEHAATAAELLRGQQRSANYSRIG